MIVNQVKSVSNCQCKLNRFWIQVLIHVMIFTHFRVMDGLIRILFNQQALKLVNLG